MYVLPVLGVFDSGALRILNTAVYRASDAERGEQRHQKGPSFFGSGIKSDFQRGCGD